MDLRSHSAIVSTELVWALEANVTGKLIVLSLPDGSTVLTAIMQRVGINSPTVGQTARDERELNSIVAAALDTPRHERASRCKTYALTGESVERLAVAIREDLDQKRELLRLLSAPTGQSAINDAAIDSWVRCAPSDAPPPAYTSSLSAAVLLVRRRISKCSFSIHIGEDNSVWAELGAQPVPESFRIAVSSTERTLDSPAKALVMALVNAELGNAKGRKIIRSELPLPLPANVEIEAQRGRERLAESFPFLVGPIQDGWRNSNAEKVLAEMFGIPRDTFDVAGEEASTNELEGVIDAVQGKSRYLPRNGPYSIAIHVGLDERAHVEIAKRVGQSNRWLIAQCNASLRPSLSLMLAAIKAEYGAFDGIQRVSDQ